MRGELKRTFQRQQRTPRQRKPRQRKPRQRGGVVGNASLSTQSTDKTNANATSSGLGSEQRAMNAEDILERVNILEHIREKCRNKEVDEITLEEWEGMTLDDLRSIIEYGTPKTCCLALSAAKWLESQDCFLKDTIRQPIANPSETQVFVSDCEMHLGKHYPQINYYYIRYFTNVADDGTIGSQVAVSKVQKGKNSVKLTFCDYDPENARIRELVRPLVPEFFLRCSLIAPLVTALRHPNLYEAEHVEKLLGDLVHKVREENMQYMYKVVTRLEKKENVPALHVHVYTVTGERYETRKQLHGQAAGWFIIPEGSFITLPAYVGSLVSKVFTYHDVQKLRLMLDNELNTTISVDEVLDELSRLYYYGTDAAAAPDRSHRSTLHETHKY